MNLLLQSFLSLQLAFCSQAETAQDSVQKTQKNREVTVTQQTQASSKDGLKTSAKWKKAYTMSILDEDNAPKQMVFMVPTELKMVEENYLGIFTAAVSPAISSQFSRYLKPQEGLLVDYVHAQSPADRAGCQRYDILVSIGKTKLKSSQQLRELVIGCAEDRKVELKLIRKAKLRTIHVELAQRQNLAGFSLVESRFNPERIVGTVNSPKNGATFSVGEELFYAPVDFNLNGRRIDRGYFSFVTPNVNHIIAPVLQAVVTTRSIFVDTRDGETFLVGCNIKGGRSNSLRGTISEIRKNSSSLPKEFQLMVRRNLDVAAATLLVERKSIKFHIKPRLVGKDYALRLNLVHPSIEGSTKAYRCFELDHIYTQAKPVKMTDLLTLKLLTSELERLKPNYRNAIIATLKKLPAPKVKLELENSQ